jgi:hypothetical protein
MRGLRWDAGLRLNGARSESVWRGVACAGRVGWGRACGWGSLAARGEGGGCLAAGDEVLHSDGLEVHVDPHRHHNHLPPRLRTGSHTVACPDSARAASVTCTRVGAVANAEPCCPYHASAQAASASQSK